MWMLQEPSYGFQVGRVPRIWEGTIGCDWQGGHRWVQAEYMLLLGPELLSSSEHFDEKSLGGFSDGLGSAE